MCRQVLCNLFVGPVVSRVPLLLEETFSHFPQVKLTNVVLVYVTLVAIKEGVELYSVACASALLADDHLLVVQEVLTFVLVMGVSVNAEDMNNTLLLLLWRDVLEAIEVVLGWLAVVALVAVVAVAFAATGALVAASICLVSFAGTDKHRY